MCEKCEALIKDAHVAFIVARGKEKKGIDLFAAGAAMFYEKIIERAAKNSAEYVKKIDSGKAHVITATDFSLAQLIAERSTIEFMLDYTGKNLLNLENAAALEISQLRNALVSIQEQSNQEEIKNLAITALAAESKFVEAVKKPKMH